jgi:hypothetical protein
MSLKTTLESIKSDIKNQALNLTSGLQLANGNIIKTIQEHDIELYDRFSPRGHYHDDRYYTKTDIDDFHNSAIMRKTYSGSAHTIELTTIKQSEYEILSAYAVRKVNTDVLKIDIGSKRSLPTDLLATGSILTSFGCDANGYFQIEYGENFGHYCPIVLSP